MRNPEGRIRLYCKGADIVLFERLHPCNQELMSITSDHLNVSSQGDVRSCAATCCPQTASQAQLSPYGTAFVCPPALIRTFVGLQEYAADGLRTLVLAYRDLAEDEWESWSEIHHCANKATSCREDRLAAAYEEIEQDMMVGGFDLSPLTCPLHVTLTHVSGCSVSSFWGPRL